jgi:hypothetical protein
MGAFFRIIYTTVFGPLKITFWGSGVALVAGALMFGFFIVALVLMVAGVDLYDPDSIANRAGGIGDWLTWLAGVALLTMVLVSFLALACATAWEGIGRLKTRPLSGIGITVLGFFLLGLGWVLIRGLYLSL